MLFPGFIQWPVQYLAILLAQMALALPFLWLAGPGEEFEEDAEAVSKRSCSVH